MAEQEPKRVAVDASGKVVKADDPSAAFIYDEEDAKRLGYLKDDEPKSPEKKKE